MSLPRQFLVWITVMVIVAFVTVLTWVFVRVLGASPGEAAFWGELQFVWVGSRLILRRQAAHDH